MLWFTGSSSEGLPFIHDSFPANPKAVHHKPKHSRQSSHPDSGASTARSTSSRDVHEVEVLDSDFFRLPAVDTSFSSNGHVKKPRSVERGERGKDPASFTSYMHRYKACARLKGISPSRAYCATRMKSTTTSDNDPADLSPTRSSPVNSFVTPLSNLRKEPKSSDPAASSTSGKEGESSPEDLPPILPQNDSGTAPGCCSAIERQIEEKLKNDSSQNDGMVVNHVNWGRTPRRRVRRGERGRHGSSSGGGVGKGGGEGRPLGDIVSPQRLQQLLSQEEEAEPRTLPHTYYRIPLHVEDGGKELDHLHIETSH
ncbi:hypothetical protein ACOMHN_026723 [Nucella lapillus]